MRFRRETGDFSIRLMAGANPDDVVAAPLPKGLSAEDFLGVFVYVEGESLAEAFGGSPIITPVSHVAVCGWYTVVIVSLGAIPTILYYDPSTGNLGTTKPPAPAGSGIALTAFQNDDASNPMYTSIASYQSTLIATGAPVTLTVDTNNTGGAIPAGEYSGSITEVTPVNADTTVTYGPNKTVTVPAGSIAVTIEYTVLSNTATAPYIYYDPTTGAIGHAALVFGNGSTLDNPGASV